MSAAARDGRPPDRLDRLRRAAAGAELDGLLVSHLPNVAYVTGFTGSSGLLLVLVAGEATLLTDFRYEEQAGDEVAPGVRVRLAREGLVSELGDLLDGYGPRRLGFEPDRLSVRQRREIGERCGGVDWEDAPPVVERMRARKEPEEIERIGRAASLVERALEEVLALVREGTTEREVAAELAYRLRLAGSGPLPFEPIVAAGPRSALPHAAPGETPLREGDLLLLDVGARVDGYCADLTRTLSLGPAAERARTVHAAVREAQEAALAAIAPGREGRDVDGAARDALERLGFGDRFGHGTGHGLGLEVHEAPSLGRRSEQVLEPGNVVTVEPGVYLAGFGGVRIEDDVVVEEGGPRLLTRFPRELLEL